MARRFTEPIFYPAKQDFYHCEFVSAEPFVIIKTKSGKLINSHLIGVYNFENISAALCIGHYFGVDETLMAEAVERYTPSNNRSQVINTDHNQIILDAYNANPNSMKAALLNLDQMKAGYKVAILGDMFELGDEADKIHHDVGESIKGAGVDRLCTFGELSQHASEAFGEGSSSYETLDALIADISTGLADNVNLLVKGSRGMRMERVVEALREEA